MRLPDSDQRVMLVRNFRGDYGLTQQALADLLYVDSRTVRRWELKERAIPGPVIAYIEIYSQLYEKIRQ